MEHNLKVLAVVNSDVVSSNLAEVFCRDSITLHHAQSGAAALILTGNSLYDLLVIAEPLADLEAETLLGSLQSKARRHRSDGWCGVSHEICFSRDRR